MLVQVRQLAETDRSAVLAILNADPISYSFLRSKIQTFGFDPRVLGAQLWGYFLDSRLQGVCHFASNLTFAGCTPQIASTWLQQLPAPLNPPSTIWGKAVEVENFWMQPKPENWNFLPLRSASWNQPLLVLQTPSALVAAEGVRVANLLDFDAIYPAAVAMYQEELGRSPELAGKANYQAKVRQQIVKGHTFVWFQDNELIFKADLAEVTHQSAQLQGVWTHPEHRKQGIGQAALAAVVNYSLANLTAQVSLYVNDHNQVARAVYHKVGFKQHGTFATLLF